MRSLVLVVAMLLAGCGGGASYECSSKVFAKWESAVPLDCAVVAANEEIAIDVLTKTDECLAWNAATCLRTGARLSQNDLGMFKPLTVHVASTKLLNEHGDDGEYDLVTGIHLDVEAYQLVHEMLHHLDAMHLSIGTVSHSGWVENGYYSTAGEYVQRSTVPTTR